MHTVFGNEASDSALKQALATIQMPYRRETTPLLRSGV